MRPFEPSQVKTFRAPKYTGIALSLLSMFVLASMFVVWNQITPQTSHKSTINIYCAKSLRLPLEACAKDFENELKINIDISYFENSNSSLPQNLNDSNLLVFYSGNDKTSESQGIENKKAITIAHDWIVFALQKNSRLLPESLAEIFDLNNTIGISHANTISGNEIKKVIGNNHYQNNYKVKFYKSESELASTLLHTDQLSGGFMTKSTALQNGLQILQLEEFRTKRLPVYGLVLNKESHTDETFKFIRFLNAPSKGNRHFKNFNFSPYKGDEWAGTPSISVFCEPLFENTLKSTFLLFNEIEKIESEILSTEKENILNTLVSISQSSAQGLMPDILLVTSSTEKKISPNYERLQVDDNFNKMNILLYRNSKYKILCKRVINFFQTKD